MARRSWSHHAQPLPAQLTPPTLQQKAEYLTTSSRLVAAALSDIAPPCHCDYAAQNGRLIREQLALRDQIGRLQAALASVACDRDDAQAEVRRLRAEAARAS